MNVSAVNKTLINNGWDFRLTDEKGVEHPTQSVDLPHDWSVTFDFDRNAAPGNDGGYLPAGKGYYTKTISFSKSDLKKEHYLYLEGVYMNPTVIVNGDTLECSPYGYSSNMLNVTKSLKAGDNRLEIIADNSHQKNCRWYSGSGIYRNVWLLTADKTHMMPWSLHITTPWVSKTDAIVNIAGIMENPDKKGTDCTIDILRNGVSVAKKNIRFFGGTLSTLLKIESPHLWSPDSPNLYTAVVTVTKKGKVLDRTEETFGIRDFRYDAEKGATLNGEPITIFGGCVHHDNGLLGARSYDAAEARKVALLKEAGFNAVRTSHNPPSPAFLYECDRQGLLVIDEAFDGWRVAKNDYDYARDFDDWAENDVAAMVLRDRNHPSIICWSIGNEIIERKDPEAVETAAKLADVCHMLDPNRPVTSALAAWDNDWDIYDPLAAEHDIVGYNYMIHKAEGDHERVPERVMWQTESFPRDAYQNWKTVMEHPYVIGDFVWTALDYIGESGIGRHYYDGDPAGEHWERPLWPWHGSYCGDIDLTGLRKPISHYRQMLFNPKEELYMAVREPDGYFGKIRTTMWGTWPTSESWNWKGHEGKDIEVEVYSDAPQVRLSLNGKEIETRNCGADTEYKTVFTLPYQPGTLEATAIHEDGTIGETRTLKTAGDPVGIRVAQEKFNGYSDGVDLIYVLAELVDHQGTVVPDSDTTVSFSVEGPATILASGSAEIKDTKSYTTPEYKTYKGRAMTIVKDDNPFAPKEIAATTAGFPSSSLTCTPVLPSGKSKFRGDRR